MSRVNVDQLGVGRDIDGVGTDIREGEGIEGIGTGLGAQRGRPLPGRVEQADGALVPSDGTVAAVVDGLGLGSSEPQEARPPIPIAPAVSTTQNIAGETKERVPRVCIQAMYPK